MKGKQSKKRRWTDIAFTCPHCQNIYRCRLDIMFDLTPERPERPQPPESPQERELSELFATQWNEVHADAKEKSLGKEFEEMMRKP